MEQLNFGISKHLDNLSDTQIDLYLTFQKEVIKTFLAYKGENETAELQKFIDDELTDMFQFEMDLVNVSSVQSFLAHLLILILDH